MRNSRRKIATQFGCALFLLLSRASLSGAQSFAYVPVVENDTCANPAQTSCTRGLIHLFNATTRTISSTFTLWQGSAGRRFLGTAASPDGLRLYVLEQVSGSAVSLLVMDTTTGTTRPFGLPVGSGVRGMKLSPDGSRLFLLGSSLQVADTATEQSIADISPVSAPANFNVEITADNRTVYVAHGTYIGAYRHLWIRAGEDDLRHRFRGPAGRRQQETVCKRGQSSLRDRHGIEPGHHDR